MAFLSQLFNSLSNALFRLFDSLSRLIEKLNRAVGDTWDRLAKGPLQSLLFYIILCVTGFIVIVKATLQEADRLLAGIEKAFISIALMAMVGLCFLDYLRREFSFFTFEVNGGMTMSVVLMVWVGFLGASLATRQKKHLAVDATDRILSPPAAKLVKRFTAFLAGLFCWQFTGYSTDLISRSLIEKEGQDALPFWDIFHGPVNTLGAFLHPANDTSQLTVFACGALLLLVIYGLRLKPQGLNKTLLDTSGALLLIVFGLGVISSFWNPLNHDQTTYTWQPIGQEIEQKVDIDQIANLVGGDDTGDTEEEAKVSSKEKKELEEFTTKSSGGERFPKWLAQSVIPLSFLLMALRFWGLAIGGRFEQEDDELDGENLPPPPPPTFWEKTTGRGKKDLIFAGIFPGILLGICAVLGMKTAHLIFLAAIMLILVGSPLFLVIGVVTVACFTLLKDHSPDMITKDMYEAVKKEELLAIPFFVLAGNLMTQGTIADRLVGVARAAMGTFPGGLGLASIMACVIFAAISGSSPVTVIAVGSIMFPMLLRDRYPESYSTGVLTSAGSLGIIIPPSVPMIIYALMVGQTLTSVGKDMIQDDGKLPGGWDPSVLQVNPAELFMAGILPGLFIAFVLAVYTLYHLRPTRKDLDIVVPEFKDGYWPNLIKEIKRGFLSIMLPVLILGGIYGILGPLRFSVTEAAAVAVVYALIVELGIHREMKVKDLPKVLSDSGVMMGSLFLIIVLAIAFNKFLTGEMIPQYAADEIRNIVSNKWQFLLLVNLFLLALGCVMDIISAILIVAPLLAPIAMSYGIHPLHFGIMFIVNLELGYLTPPLGINLFVSSTVLKRPIIEVIKSTIPFLLLMLFCLAVIVFFPYLSLAFVEG